MQILCIYTFIPIYQAKTLLRMRTLSYFRGKPNRLYDAVVIWVLLRPWFLTVHFYQQRFLINCSGSLRICFFFPLHIKIKERNISLRISNGIYYTKNIKRKKIVAKKRHYNTQHNVYKWPTQKQIFTFLGGHFQQTQ